MVYKILIAEKDFLISPVPNSEIVGKDVKFDAISQDNKKAFFKRQNTKRKCYDAVSEKLAYELSKQLGYNCAKNELARDLDGNIGILTFDFTDVKKENRKIGVSHYDFGRYFGIRKEEIKEKYTLKNIKKNLDKIDKSLYDKFLSLMMFDALIGMGDRHENNWGITVEQTEKGNKKSFSPFYDNSGSLLHNAKESDLGRLRTDKQNWENHILRSKSKIFDDNKRQRKHFDIVEEIKEKNPGVYEKEIRRIMSLSDDIIREIVSMLPSELLSELRKEMIIRYIIARKEIILWKNCG